MEYEEGGYEDETFSEAENYNNRQYANELESASDISTIDSTRRRQKKLWNDIKKMDKGFHSIKRYGKTIEIYSTSNRPGAFIRNAVTGAKFQEYRVGTLKEHLFFKVRFSSGGIPDRDGTTLFFDSPEQYERHMLQTLSSDIKTKWLSDYNYYSKP
jgi:hypothetical protein